MTKLKTLKDLEGNQGRDYMPKYVLSRDLKQEAIKDINALYNLDKSPQDKLWEKTTGMNIKYSQDAIIGIINYIKWKFNITKEDLK